MRLNKKKYLLLFLFLFLLFKNDVQAKNVNSFNWCWFFYEQGNEYNKNYTVYRPFYLRNENIYSDEAYVASLPPAFFWKYESKKNITRYWLFGFARDDDYIHSNGISDYDFGLFPFIFYGNSKDANDKYFMLWPIGGSSRGKIGQEYINAWIFPGVSLFFLYPPTSIYMTGLYIVLSIMPIYSNYGRKGYHAESILWPLIRWGSGDGKKTFRFMPFYSHSYRKDYYDSYSYLMLFNYRKLFLSNRTMTTFFAVPFFGRRWTSDRNAGSSTLFWPFFSWGFNKRSGDFELNFPWPLFQYQKSQDPYIRKLIMFPFYGKYTNNNNKMKFVTPLYFNLSKKGKNYSSDYYVVSFIFWYFKREYKNIPSPYYGHSWKYFKIWPLFKYESNDLGDLSIRILSILPFRDPEGYERMYSPFWSLFEYSRSRDGTKKLGLLLRTYFQYWGDNFFMSKVPLLFTYSSYNNRIDEFTVLFSSFGYKYNKDGKYIKVFWIPIKIGDGRKDKHPKEELIATREDDILLFKPEFKESEYKSHYMTLYSYSF